METDVPTDGLLETGPPTDNPEEIVEATDAPTDTPVPTDVPIPTDAPVETDVPTDGLLETGPPTDNPEEIVEATDAPTDAPLETEVPTDGLTGITEAPSGVPGGGLTRFDLTIEITYVVNQPEARALLTAEKKKDLIKGKSFRKLQQTLEPTEEELDTVIENTFDFYVDAFESAFPETFEDLVGGDVTDEILPEGLKVTYNAVLVFSDPAPTDEEIGAVIASADYQAYLRDLVRPAGDYFAQVIEIMIDFEVSATEESITLAPSASATEPSVETDAPTEEELGSIVDIAVDSPDLSTLVGLLTQTGLDEVLSGDGPFTVFAPSNEAFAALDPAILEAISSDPDLLTDVLLYHVVEGTVLSSDLSDGAMVPTVNGANVTTFLNPPRVNNANITAADVLASNGVIHIMDAVSWCCLLFTQYNHNTFSHTNAFFSTGFDSTIRRGNSNPHSCPHT